MATDVRTTQPKEYYRKFLEQDVRPDGRELGEIRPTTLNVGLRASSEVELFVYGTGLKALVARPRLIKAQSCAISTADGSALVKLGNTAVICGIKGELTEPKSAESKKGFIVPNVELPPLCSAQFRPGPPSEQAQVASLFMDRLIKNSKCVNLEDLSLIEGKLCWVLYCDLMCLDYDGNLLDACCMAFLAALRNIKLPKVSENEQSGLPDADLKKMSPLNVASQPVATSFSVFDDQIVFADPTSEEEALATGAVTIVTLEDKLCMVHKPGGSHLSEKQLQDCIDRAENRGNEVRQLMDETIKDVDR